MQNNNRLEENLRFLGMDDTAEGSSLRALTDDRSSTNQLLSKSGLPVTRVTGEDGRWHTLHSIVDPLREAECFVSKIAFETDKIIVILGAGDGYHIESICRHTAGQPLIIVEKNAGVMRQMLAGICLSSCSYGRSIYVIRADDCRSAIQKISHIQVTHNLMGFTMVEHPPSVRAFPTFYKNIANELETINGFDFGRRLRHDKFTSKQLRVLVLHSKYYLLYEILNSLKKLGHMTRTVMVPSGRGGRGEQQTLEKILSEVATFKPDFVLTVNHLGFDREGILTNFFTDIRLPYASWYVDSPLFILEDFKRQASPYLAIFVWDSDYMQDLKERGFEHVQFLPLATEPDIFRKMVPDSNPLRHLSCNVGFVGNSGERIIAECMTQLQSDEHIRDLVDKLAVQFSQSKARSIIQMTPELRPEEEMLYNKLMNTMRASLEPAVTWRATQLYRLDCIKHLFPFRPCIHGDDGWHRHINGHTILRPELNYYDELPCFYNACTINFNTTSLQMKGGVNQRVFDVPACMGFIITDYREQIEHLFEVGKEVICYQHPEEIGDLVRYFLRHDSQRERVCIQAHKRIAREHTYTHRLEKLIDHMRHIYA